MNENNNRVQTDIPQDIYDLLMKKIREVADMLNPFMQGMSPEERIAMPKINVDNKIFVEDAIMTMDTPVALQIIPAFLKKADAEQDLHMYEQLDAIATQFSSLMTKVDETRMLAGSEAFGTALTFKKLADAATASGVPGAKDISDKLRDRFLKSSGTGTDPKPDDPNPPA